MCLWLMMSMRVVSFNNRHDDAQCKGARHKGHYFAFSAQEKMLVYSLSELLELETSQYLGCCIIFSRVVLNMSVVQKIGGIDVPYVSRYITVSSCILLFSQQRIGVSLLPVRSPRRDPLWRWDRDVPYRARSCMDVCLFKL